MRVSREKALESREQVIKMAAQLLREKGYDGIGVADIMKAAGMTHGGFYRHFASKDDLVVKASEYAVADRKAVVMEALAHNPPDPFRVLVERYVSNDHRDAAGTGCILPALATDAARSDDPKLRDVFTSTIQEYIDQLGPMLAAQSGSQDARAPAALLAEMVGAVILARVVNDGALADKVIADVVEDIVGP